MTAKNRGETVITRQGELEAGDVVTWPNGWTDELSQAFVSLLEPNDLLDDLLVPGCTVHRGEEVIYRAEYDR